MLSALMMVSISTLKPVSILTHPQLVAERFDCIVVLNFISIGFFSRQK